MGKTKKPKGRALQSNPHRKPAKSTFISPKLSRKLRKTGKAVQPLTPAISFSSADRILLVGEGDFSFSHSLLTAHGCSSLVATSYDKKIIAQSKYPQSAAYIKALEEEKDCKVLYGVDATKLGKSGAIDGGGKCVKKGNFDKVVFNFPHVGGLTKDINRQVRHNQELLVGFFKSALPLLAAEGMIIVTIFDGEPYELWNIKDLARHSGLKVGRSFKFQANEYPGYKHARTLGNIDGGGGWKGEIRPARTYMFEVNDPRAQEEPESKHKSKVEDSDSEID